jgi:hypothetical protein
MIIHGIISAYITLIDRIVTKEHLTSKRTVYYALEDERFTEYKDQKHVAVRKGVKSRCKVASTSFGSLPTFAEIEDIARRQEEQKQQRQSNQQQQQIQ